MSPIFNSKKGSYVVGFFKFFLETLLLNLIFIISEDPFSLLLSFFVRLFVLFVCFWGGEMSYVLGKYVLQKTIRGEESFNRLSSPLSDSLEFLDGSKGLDVSFQL